MIIRPYQSAFIRNIALEIKAGFRKVCCQLATGGGKTVIFSAITDRFVKKQNKSVLIVVHRIELLKQTRKALFNYFGVEAFQIKAGVKYIPPASCYVAMVESLANRMSKLADKNIGLVIIDECHIQSFNKIQAHFPEATILGFSATPKASSKKHPIKNYYETIVCGEDIPFLIKEKFLCQNMTWAPEETVKRLELAIKGDDYDDVLMGEAFSRPKYIDNTVKAYERWGRGKKTLIFNVNVEHSKTVNQAFVSAGYDSKHLDGNTPHAERVDILDWFLNTPDAILNNVGIATVGFDEPTIELVIVNKATLSMPLWIQMCGRGSRVIDEYFIKERQKLYAYELWLKGLFTIIDMGGNGLVHGDWSQSRDWKDIFWNPPKPGSNEGVAPTKSCPQCNALIPASAKVCPYCGFIYDAKSIPLEVELRDFVMITKDIDVNQLMLENQHRKDYYSFFQIGRKLAKEAKNNIAVMKEEYFNFILQTYFEKGKEWVRKYNEKHASDKDRKIKKFNQWHRNLAQETLFTEIKQYFPEWEQPHPLAITEELII